MISWLLEWAWMYKLSQRFWYRPGQQPLYVTAWIQPRAGDRVLDIGCGPATLLQWMPEVDYVGYDPNARYIADARAHSRGRGRFICGYLRQLPRDYSGSFDLVLANGVLHHMADEDAARMLSLAREALRPGGRIVTRDGCWEKMQSPFVRFLLRTDRGKFVRTQEGYEALFRPHFDLVRAEIRRDVLRLPYSLIHCEAVKRV